MAHDRWQVRDTVETEDGEVEVSTVELQIAHGPNRDQHYETCLFSDSGSRVNGRYETKEEAEEGHQKAISALESGNYTVNTVPTGITVDVNLYP